MVVINKIDYQTKVEEHLSDRTTYKIIENDRQKYLQNKVNKLLQKLKSQKKIEK